MGRRALSYLMSGMPNNTSARKADIEAFLDGEIAELVESGAVFSAPELARAFLTPDSASSTIATSSICCPSYETAEVLFLPLSGSWASAGRRTKAELPV